MSRRTRIVLALLAGCALLAFALRGLDLGHIGSRIGDADLKWIGLAAIVYLSAYFVRSLRWRLILRPIQRVTVRESFFMLMAGYFLNYIIPIRAGEIAKSFFLKRMKGVPIAVSLPTVFLDKLLELFSIIIVLVLVPILSVQLSGSLVSLMVTVLVVFVLAVGLLLLAIRNREMTVRLVAQLTSWLPRRAHERVSSWLALFINGLSMSASSMSGLWALLALTGGAVLLDAVYFRLMFMAFGIGVSFTTVLFGYTLISLSYILPTPPAQIGYNEMIMGLIFAAGLGMPRGEVMAVMLLAHPLTGVIITLVGLCSFSAMSIRLTDSFRQIEVEGALVDAATASCPDGAKATCDSQEVR
ncbi:flippase-like domain-containing protein [bacterium]|nr:flippase-like domain-containing protein [bacterium]